MAKHLRPQKPRPGPSSGPQVPWGRPAELSRECAEEELPASERQTQARGFLRWDCSGCSEACFWGNHEETNDLSRGPSLTLTISFMSYESIDISWGFVSTPLVRWFPTKSNGHKQAHFSLVVGAALFFCNLWENEGSLYKCINPFSALALHFLPGKGWQKNNRGWSLLARDLASPKSLFC